MIEAIAAAAALQYLCLKQLSDCLTVMLALRRSQLNHRYLVLIVLGSRFLPENVET